MPAGAKRDRALTAMRLTGLIVLLTICGFDVARAEGVPTGVCEREMLRASNAFGVPLAVLYAVGLTETGRRSSLQPLALNVEGRPFFAQTLSEALAHFAAAKRKGAILIDLGCMQINHHFHGREFSSLTDMFDPALNVTYAARFLRELHRREKTWTLAVARYHAGPHNDPAQKRYVCTVIANMVASGFGRWTSQSSTFCEGWSK